MENDTIILPVHPGEILLEDYLKPSNMSQNQLALKMRIPAQRISEIINKKRKITPDTAIRLSLVIGTTPEFWLSLQCDYDLQTEMIQNESKIRREVMMALA